MSEGRGLLFWSVCIPLRTWLGLHATEKSYALRVFAAVIGTRWLAGLENGNEGVFGGPAWWKEERPAHGAMWLGYALSGDKHFILLDTAYGALNWLGTPKT